MTTMITITREDGLRVRTATGKRYYVTIPNGSRAKVIKRTNDVGAANREAARWSEVEVWENPPAGLMLVRRSELAARHAHKLAAARSQRRIQRAVGNNGEARRLSY